MPGKLQISTSKYRNRKLEVDGHVFDSRKEVARYEALRLMEQLGQIRNLELQPQFKCNVCGKKICTYRADFAYEQPNENRQYVRIVEDVKSEPTRRNPVYRLKKKLVEALYNIEIRET